MARGSSPSGHYLWHSGSCVCRYGLRMGMMRIVPLPSSRVFGAANSTRLDVICRDLR
jgi:hypothetical protein